MGDNEMKKVEIKISNGKEPTMSSGTVSQISWQNASAIRGLRTMFGCKDNEMITNIEVTEVGIKAQFEKVT
jgi:glucan biosynthesis protein